MDRFEVGKKKRAAINSRPFCSTARVYCSPPVAFVPHITLLPHITLVPHMTLLPHIAFVLVPHMTLLPHVALLPQSALLPHMTLEPLMVDDGAPATNCCDPHTAAFDHVDEVFQTAVELSLR